MKKKTKNIMANEFTIGKISVNYTLQAHRSVPPDVKLTVYLMQILLAVEPANSPREGRLFVPRDVTYSKPFTVGSPSAGILCDFYCD